MTAYKGMLLMGLMATVVLYLARAKRFRFSYRLALGLALILGVAGFAGAKLLYVFEHFSSIVEEGFAFHGLSLYGVIFTGPAVSALFAKPLERTCGEIGDYCAPALMLCMMFFRVGCMLTGCCGGIYWHNFQIPTQLIEFLGSAMIFLYLMWLEEKNVCQGKYYPLMMALYGGFRFFLEFFRASPEPLFGLSNGQWYSIVSLIWGIIWLVWKGRMYGDSRKKAI